MLKNYNQKDSHNFYLRSNREERIILDSNLYKFTIDSKNEKEHCRVTLYSKLNQTTYHVGIDHGVAVNYAFYVKLLHLVLNQYQKLTR